MINKSGHKTEPCGMPRVTETDCIFLILNCFLSLKYDEKQRSALSDIPIQASRSNNTE